MTKSKIISTILSLMALPVSFYITYWIISQLDADRLIWFLFWIYVPLVIIVIIISKIGGEE